MDSYKCSEMESDNSPESEEWQWLKYGSRRESLLNSSLGSKEVEKPWVSTLEGISMKMKLGSVQEEEISMSVVSYADSIPMTFLKVHKT